MAKTTTQDIGRYLEQQLRAKGRNAVMTYGDLLEVFNDLPDFTGAWSSHPLCDMFGELDIEDASLGRPFRTAVVVSKDDRVPGGGFFKMYVQYRDPNARIRSDLDRIEVHQRELRAVAAHYGHP
jgi:hypothetical protein